MYQMPLGNVVLETFNISDEQFNIISGFKLLNEEVAKSCIKEGRNN